MTALPQPTPPLEVSIKTGPHGNNTELLIDGEKAKHAAAFTLSADCNGATKLTVEYVNIHAEVDALVETTAFDAKNRSYKRVTLSGESANRPPAGDNE